MALCVFFVIMAFVRVDKDNEHHLQKIESGYNCAALFLYIPFYSFLVYGIYLRYCHTSRVCSGDFIDQDEQHSLGQGPYLWNSGMFSKIIVPCLIFVEALRLMVY